MAAPVIPYDGQASTNAQQVSTWEPAGALNKLVIQKVDYANDLGRPECEVYLKGPYKKMRELASELGAISASTWASFKSLATSHNVPVDTGLDPLEPYAGLSATYPILNYRLTQGQDGAGVHGEMTLTMGVYDDNGGGGGGGQVLQNSEVWNLTWQPESWDVYRFCANEGLSAMRASDPNSGWNDHRTADSVHIQRWLDQSQDEDQNKYQFQTSVSSKRYVLNQAEQLVAKKKKAGLQPVYHYPVLSKSTTYQSTGSLPQVTDVGDRIDTIWLGIPTGCPFTFTAPWGQEWIKTGDTINMSREASTGTTTYTRTETWQGAIDADINFYSILRFDHNNLSACRWEFGRV